MGRRVCDAEECGVRNLNTVRGEGTAGGTNTGEGSARVRVQVQVNLSNK